MKVEPCRLSWCCSLNNSVGSSTGEVHKYARARSLSESVGFWRKPRRLLNWIRSKSTRKDPFVHQCLGGCRGPFPQRGPPQTPWCRLLRPLPSFPFPLNAVFSVRVRLRSRSQVLGVDVSLVMLRQVVAPHEALLALAALEALVSWGERGRSHVFNVKQQTTAFVFKRVEVKAPRFYPNVKLINILCTDTENNENILISFPNTSFGISPSQHPKPDSYVLDIVNDLMS